MENCVEFLEGRKMKLKVNRDKSSVGSPTKTKFLGFGLYTRKDGTKGIRIHPKSVKRFKGKVKEITKRNRGKSFDKIVAELKKFTDGWIQYFGIADMKTLMDELNQWIRRRLRMYIWKQWKKIGAKARNLMKLGATKRQAWEWANTRQSYWHIAKKLDSFYYHYKRPPRTPRICRYPQEVRDGALKLSNRRIPNGTYGGVRGRLLS